jgi:hypothetical protein
MFYQLQNLFQRKLSFVFVFFFTSLPSPSIKRKEKTETKSPWRRSSLSAPIPKLDELEHEKKVNKLFNFSLLISISFSA